MYNGVGFNTLAWSKYINLVNSEFNSVTISYDGKYVCAQTIKGEKAVFDAITGGLVFASSTTNLI